MNRTTEKQVACAGTVSYAEFLAAKAVVAPPCGLERVPELSASLFSFQRDIVSWALRRGRAAIFADCGMGKTLMQLEWARHLPGNALVLAPLAVAKQTVAEGERFGIPVRYCRSQAECEPGITITNYEMLDRFDPAAFVGIVLDESSILKAYDGKTRTRIIETFRQTPYRLACTATPAPNDYMELGNHAEFLGVTTRPEMLAMFFVHDGGETQTWRLKGHAERDFWRWLASWAVMIRKPSDLGYDDGDFVLPPIHFHEHVLRVDRPTDGMLFAMEAVTLQERIAARRETIAERVTQAANLLYDWQPCGKNSTPSVDGSNINLTQKSGSTASTRADLLMKTAPTCERITPPTNTNGESEPLISAPSITKRGAPDIGQIQSSGNFLRPKSGRGAQTAKRECSDSNYSTDFQQNNGMPSSTLRAAVAQFAAPRMDEAAIACTSTTATKAGASEGFCVRNATSELANFEISPIFYGAPQSILKEPWIIWCNLNSEQGALERACGNDAVSIYGSLSHEEKERRIASWLSGEKPILISKVTVCGYGLNFQHCRNVAFVGLSDSWEAFYQAVRRCYRFGQKREVHVHLIVADTEGAVLRNIQAKEAAAAAMAENIVEHMRVEMRENVKGTQRTSDACDPDVEMRLPEWLPT